MDRLQHLTLRVNRTLGVALIHEGMLTPEAMAQANERFLTALRKESWATASLLRILAWEMKVLPESILIRHLLEKYKVPTISLQNYSLDSSLLDAVKLEAARATRSFPIDHQENTWFLVTAYYLSYEARKYWEELLPGEHIWYATTLEEIEQNLAEFEAASISPPIA